MANTTNTQNQVINIDVKMTLPKELKMMQDQLESVTRRADQMAAALRKSGQNIGTGATEAIRNMGNTAADSQKKFGRFNQVVQNSSYQVTDFVVSLQNGQTALKAFGQQAPQFLGVFGPAGAAAGLAAALGAALVSMAVDSKGAAKEVDAMAKAVSSFDEAIQASAATLTKIDLEPLVKQFNEGSAATRKLTMDLIQLSLVEADVALLKMRNQVKGFGDEALAASQKSAGMMQVFFGSATASEGIFGKGGSAGQAKNFSDNIKDMTSGLLTSTQVLERWGSTLAAAGTEKSQEYLAALVGLAKSENTAELGAAKLRKTLEQMQAAGEKGLIPTADSAKKAAKELKDAETAAQKAAKAFQKAEDERGKLANAMQDAALEADLADMLNAQKAADELQLLIDKGAELNDELIDIEANSAALSKEQESLDKTMYDTWLKSLPVMEQVNVQVEEMRNRFALLGMEVDEAFMKDYTKQLTESLTKTDDAMEKLATTMTSQVGRALDDFFVAAIKGKASFSDFAESVLADVARIVTQMLIIEPLIADLKAGFANVMNPDSTGSFWDKMFAPSAKGNVFGFAKGGAFTNMLVNAATPFMFANGGSFNMGVMGEAGPEAVVPLRRTSSGDLGVTASPVTVNINNSSGADVQATSRQGPNGATIIDVEVKRRVKEMFSNGEMDRVMRSNYQISRTGL